jgi:ribosomal protein L37AE/L43A
MSFDSSLMTEKVDKKSITAGFITFIIGLLVYLFGPIDFRGAPVNRATGIIIGLFGIGVILTSIFRRKEYLKHQTSKVFCSDCGAEYLEKNVAVYICPRCNGKLNGTKNI